MSAAPQLAFEVHPGCGPYLGLLHGFLSSSSQWRHNLAALSTVCRPVTIELWGHGASPTPEQQQAYHPHAYIDQLEQIRKSLGVQTWFLCGYSLGAGITIRYAEKYPQRTLAHIFTNSTSALASEKQVQSWRRDAQNGAQRLLEGGMRAIERIPVHPRFAKRLPHDIYHALLADANKITPLGVANAIRETTPNATIRDIAAKNTRPALLCFGKHEGRFSANKAWAEQHMTNLTVAELDAGHAVNMEDAEGFNQVVAEFICLHSA